MPARHFSATIAASALMAALAGPAAHAGEPAPLHVEGPAHDAPWKRYADWPQKDWSAFNTLAKLASPKPPEPGKMIKIEGEVTGDPENGMKLAFDRKRGGSCLACHVMGPKTAELPGNVGPDLSELGTLGRTDEYLYNHVYDARVINPESVMPPWGAHGVFNDKEIRDIVAFLKSLKQPAKFKNELDDPAKRPTPVENRDNLDEFVNPGMAAVEEARAAYAKAGPAGKSCADCHAEPEKVFKTWAATMPKWEPRLKRVMGVEEFVYRHAKATTGDHWPMQSPANTHMAVYLRYLANGTPIDVDTESPEAKAAIARAEELTRRKIGQLNFACVDCHTRDKGANHWIRGQWLGEQRGQLPHFPTWRTSKQEIWDIRKRFQWCGVAIRANELPPEAPEYGDLELYLAAQNEGLKLNVPGIRH